MKIKIFITQLLFLAFVVIISKYQPVQQPTLRSKHAYFLENSPFKLSKNISKQERKALGIPPNRYYENEWELNMNPAIGRPTPENLMFIKKDILAGKYDMFSYEKSVPGDENNFWIERGPNNVGGRTKAVLFDPNDPNRETVFAGGVSGGLWKNTNISNVNSPWNLINVPAHLNVSSITVDPNNTNIFYLGTGESYTSGDGVGNGVWKSIDAGATWTQIFGGFEGTVSFQSNALVKVNLPENIAGDYAAVKAAFGPELNVISGDLALVNDGSTTPTLGCFDLINPSAIFGKIAVIQRGDCVFVQKVRFAQQAGAKAVLMINNVSGEPITMGVGTEDTSDIIIPSVMVSLNDGLKIMSAIRSGNVNVSFTARESIASGFYLLPGKSHINDIIAVNNNGTTELFAAVGDSYYSGTNSPLTIYGSGDVGVYKSLDDGTTWSKMSLPSTQLGNFYVPMDLEYSINNTLWVSTTASFANSDGGGAVLSSTNHQDFLLKYLFTNGKRTEIAISKTNPNLLYAVCHLSNIVQEQRVAPYIGLVKTNDEFGSTINLILPNDNYSGIPDDDFTNTQSWFDLAIETNPANDQIVYLGGINWHQSSNGGNSWFQFSNSYGGAFPNIHPDQHGMTFANANKIMIGNDGGVVITNDGGVTLKHQNKNFNVTQFYRMAVAPTTLFTGEYFVGGTQDNGSQKFENAPAGLAPSFQAQGGDGGYCFFDQFGDKYYITNYIYNKSINLYNYNTGNSIIINSESGENGDFICQQELDSRLNILYANYSSGTSYAIRRYMLVSLVGSGLVQKTTLTNTLMTASPTAFKVSPFTTTSTTLLVGLKNGKILKVNNANSTDPFWTDISSTVMVGSISDIEFGQTEQELFVTIHNYGVKSIWYSANGGSTWVEKEGNLPDMPVKSILQNPLRPNQVIIGTEMGTWWTQNFESSAPIWYYGSNGINSVKVTDLQMRNDFKVYAATYGRGIFSGQFTATDGTVGIDEELSSGLKLFPNPAIDFVNISSKTTLIKPIFKVFDANNKLVRTFKSSANGEIFKINIENLKTGVYLLQISSNSKIYASKFIVK